MSAVVTMSSDGAACSGHVTRQPELVTPDSQTHISSTNQYALPTHAAAATAAVKQVMVTAYAGIGIGPSVRPVASPGLGAMGRGHKTRPKLKIIC